VFANDLDGDRNRPKEKARQRAAGFIEADQAVPAASPLMPDRIDCTIKQRGVARALVRKSFTRSPLDEGFPGG
jgi:hypothetical protein